MKKIILLLLFLITQSLFSQGVYIAKNKPSNAMGCKLWLIADSGKVDNSGCGQTITALGAEVIVNNEKNGHKAWHFTGATTDNRLQCILKERIDTPCTIIMVIKDSLPDISGGWGWNENWWLDGTNSVHRFGMFEGAVAAAPCYHRYFPCNDWYVHDWFTYQGGWHVITQRYATRVNNTNSYDNGVLYCNSSTCHNLCDDGVTTSTCGIDAAWNANIDYTEGFIIGGSSGGNCSGCDHARGYLCELIVYGRSLSATEQLNIQNYLNKKYLVDLGTTLATISDTVCSGVVATLKASGANTYTWNNGQTGSSMTVSPTITTTYTVTGYMMGYTNTAQVICYVTGGAIVASASALNYGQSATLTAQNGATYLWSTIETAATITVTPTATITYVVTSTNYGINCTNSQKITMSCAVGITASEATLINGCSSILTASGASTYTWSNAETTTAITVSPSATTTYTVTGTIVGVPCTATQLITLTAFAITPALYSCNPCTDKVFTASTFTCSATYSWSTGATISTITVSPTTNTTYTCSAIAGGITNTAQATISVGFQPSDSTGLVLWLQADKGVIDSSNIVSQWNDLSGSGNNAVQINNVTKRPLLVVNQLNGNPIVRFDGINDCMNIPYSANLNTTSLSVFIVSKQTATSGEAKCLISTLVTTNGYQILYSDGTNTITQAKANGTYASQNNVIASTTIYKEFNFINKTDNVSELYMNGTYLNYLIKEINYQGNNNMVGIGYQPTPSGCNFLNGDEFLILIYNHAITAQLRQNVEAYIEIITAIDCTP